MNRSTAQSPGAKPARPAV